ncbi:hypothetical protein QCA50_003814 [Cerrena zonata]|uniref:Uncharacterized protein n=1 Tax=Cerrena zonata TaxID=2478898 RepID=A0AAW0GFS4_9APHY
MPSYNAILAEIDTLIANLKAYPDRSGHSATYVINLCKQKLSEAETAMAGVVDEGALAHFKRLEAMLKKA